MSHCGPLFEVFNIHVIYYYHIAIIRTHVQLKPSQGGPLHTPGASGSERGIVIAELSMTGPQQSNKDQGASTQRGETTLNVPFVY